MININERITKKTNLHENDSLSSFDGHAAQQFHGAYEVFYNFFKSVKPKKILEIGTALGGFTMFMKIICDEIGIDTKILSYDIHYRDWYEDLKKDGIDIRVENIFGDDFNQIPNYVKEYIESDGTTIILCDGGWKIGEFNLLSNFIKKGDFILAHDYAEDNFIFENKIKGRIWNWHEIQESDIKQSCEKNNLIEFNKDIFENVAWTCRIKI